MTQLIKDKKSVTHPLNFVAGVNVPSAVTPHDDAYTNIRSYKSLAFFVERTEEAIARATALLSQLDAEMIRLRYEVNAMQNEHKNLKMVLSEREETLKKKSN